MIRSALLFVFIMPALPLWAAGHLSNNMPSPQNDTVYYIPGVLKETARLYSDKDNASSVVMYVPADSSVMIIDTAGTFFLIHYQGIDGYIRQKRVKQYKEILYELTVPADMEMAKEPTNRHDYLIFKYGQEEGRKMYEHMIWKGMTSEMVLDSWGKPQVINHYTTSTGYREDWIYPKHVLSFTNGILTGWIER